MPDIRETIASALKNYDAARKRRENGWRAEDGAAFQQLDDVLTTKRHDYIASRWGRAVTELLGADTQVYAAPENDRHMQIIQKGTDKYRISAWYDNRDGGSVANYSDRLLKLEIKPEATNLTSGVNTETLTGWKRTLTNAGIKFEEPSALNHMDGQAGIKLDIVIDQKLPGNLSDALVEKRYQLLKQQSRGVIDNPDSLRIALREKIDAELYGASPKAVVLRA
jgi:hypothetical protein